MISLSLSLSLSLTRLRYAQTAMDQKYTTTLLLFIRLHDSLLGDVHAI